jgi:excisionase family DNA binding protein
MQAASVVSRRYISIAEAAEYLRISDRTVRRLIADGELTGYRMGRSHRVIRVDLNEIDERRGALVEQHVMEHAGA